MGDEMMKAVIMAGGKGTRIASINAEVPKPMIGIDGKPILQYQIECLARQGITDILLVIGYLGRIIEEYFCDGNAFDPYRAVAKKLIKNLKRSKSIAKICTKILC